jgi:hypothetical protein
VLLSPTITRAEKENLLPPLTTLATLFTATTLSSTSTAPSSFLSAGFLFLLPLGAAFFSSTLFIIFSQSFIPL